MTGLGVLMLSIMGLGHVTIPRSQIISRTDWGARPPKQIEYFKGPAPYVVIHHSYLPAACQTTDKCKDAMRSMQDFHQLDRGWNDIGYSFAIGGDGMVYTGRGFNVIGAHAPKYNDRSVGICLIGDWRSELPPPQMLQAAKDLIHFGVVKGYIDPEFKLIGHKQVRDTECPGGRLFHEISTWPNFEPNIGYAAGDATKSVPVNTSGVQPTQPGGTPTIATLTTASSGVSGNGMNNLTTLGIAPVTGAPAVNGFKVAENEIE